jgi:F-box/leucine-rich repeat protein 2/20
LKKLPLLEELEISNCRLVHFISFEVIGQCCPLLKSLNLHGYFNQVFACDDEALAIARTMPGLRDLKIVKNTLTNAGLLAILDGCPLLESLDLRGCFQLDLSGSLGKRCNEQIKEVRLPTDFIDEPDDTSSTSEDPDHGFDQHDFYDFDFDDEDFYDGYDFYLLSSV